MDIDTSPAERRDALGADTAVGVAISGGGLRAAIYAVGAVLYLVHSGLHRNLALISSVSGGSIVNAVFALDGDTSQVDPERFTRLSSRLTHRMSKRGVFFFAGMKRMLAALVILALAPAAVEALLWLFGFQWSWAELAWFEGIYFVPMTLYLVGFLVLGRRSIQVAAYRECVLQVLHPWHEKKALRNPKLEDIPVTGVAHVLCATELTSGQPLYMSRDMVLSPRYGRGRPALHVAEAIYASAAFPIGFPPLRVRSSRLDLSGGTDDEVPKQLVLSDGGVFNNLGTDAFTADRAAEQIYLPDPRLAILPEVHQQLIVNASAPPKKWEPRQIPVVRSFASSARIMSVLYENTLTPRIQSLLEDQVAQHGPLVVDISESPIRLLARVGKESPAAAARADAMRAELLREMSEQQWDDYADRAASTKTVLSPVGRTSAVRLARLGYLGMAAACHVRFNSRGVEGVPNDRWFQCLVDDKLSDEDITAILVPNPDEENVPIS